MSAASEAEEEKTPTPQPPPPGGEGEPDNGTPRTQQNSEGLTPPLPSPRAAEIAHASEARHAGSTGEGAGGGGSSQRSRRKRALVVAFAAVGFAVWYFAVRTPEPTDDLGRFQGEWQLAVPAVVRDNKPTARATPVTVRVTGDRWIYVANGQERGHYLVALRPEASPKEIDLVQLTPDGKPTAFVIRGVYTIDRTRAKIAHAPDPDPRPTDPDDPDATVWLLERAK